MSFDSEYEAFCEYAKYFSDNLILLIDTYNVLKSGLPNAIKIFKSLINNNQRPKKYGVRIDSGDFAYLTKKIREQLDNEDLKDALIIVSNDLDENLILSLKSQGAKINSWGIGTKLITADGSSALGGVYKLAAIEDNNKNLVPKIKISENPEKITTPGFKQIFRIYDKKSNKIKADLLALQEETFSCEENLVLFNPTAPWQKINLEKNNYYIKPMLINVISNGKKIYDSPDILKIKNYCQQELNTLWDEYKRIINPEVMPVDLSNKLFNIKQALLK